MKQFQTPILFIIFNRLETTIQVFEAIRKIKPSRLFIAADGPRIEKEDEVEKCKEVREYVLSRIDWDCEVKTLFSDINLGCGYGPSNAISWFFENVDKGIILEDDCLPSKSFFNFCGDLLEKYEDNNEVMIISGFNQLNGFDGYADFDYIFTEKAGIWGWATWKRAWNVYNFNVPEWTDMKLQKIILDSLKNEDDRFDMKFHMDKICSNRYADFWDYQWWFYRLLHNGLGIVPKHSLIKNIGFRDDATHTFDKNNFLAHVSSSEIQFPLKHPDVILKNEKYEEKIKLQLDLHNKKTVLKESLIQKCTKLFFYYKNKMKKCVLSITTKAVKKTMKFSKQLINNDSVK